MVRNVWSSDHVILKIILRQDPEQLVNNISGALLQFINLSPVFKFNIVYFVVFVI